VRVANNGITAIVGPHGRISSLLPRNGALALDGGLPRASLSTVFANWGAIVVVLLMFLCLLAWVCLSRLNLQLK
jgi:apolipoprotein N-acyltransferase